MTPEERDRKLAELLSEARSRLEAAQVLLSTNLSPSAPVSGTQPTPPPSTQPSPTVPPAGDSVPKLAWGKKVGLDFKKFVLQTAVDFKVGRTPEEGANWFMACMAFETMESFSPSVRPLRKDGTRISSAVGLIQFLEATARALGTTTDKLAAMDRMKQLEYVWLYFRNFLRDTGKTLASLEDVYMVIHWPRAVGLPNSATMYVGGSREYLANAGLDINKDGIITKAEAGRLVRAKLDKGLQPEYYG